MRPEHRPGSGNWRAGLAELADLILPRPCPGCGGPQPWCAGCASTLRGRPREPVLPDAALQYHAGPLPVFRSLARYRGPVRAAIIAGKERGRRDLPPLLGVALGEGLLRLQAISVVPNEAVLIAAPTRAAAARARGGDPVQAMANAAAAVLLRNGRHAAVARCLFTRSGARDSVGLTPAQRTQNLAGRIGLRDRQLPATGTAVVLIDDVLTTGATALASCAVLARHGCDVVAVITLAAVPPWRQVR